MSLTELKTRQVDINEHCRTTEKHANFSSSEERSKEIPYRNGKATSNSSGKSLEQVPTDTPWIGIRWMDIC